MITYGFQDWLFADLKSWSNIFQAKVIIINMRL
jgi:hypothetical protein